MPDGSDVKDGDRITLVTYQGGEYPVKVIHHTTIGCDVVVQWLGIRPDLNHDGMSTVCLRQVRSIRRG